MRPESGYEKRSERWILASKARNSDVSTHNTTQHNTTRSRCIRDRLLMEMPVESALKELTSAIEYVFGFTPYPWQRDVFTKVLIGQQDIMVSAGTAQGKSLCYQGMALSHSEATVLVISPIKGLMDDQVHEPKAIELLIAGAFCYDTWIA